MSSLTAELLTSEFEAFRSVLRDELEQVKQDIMTNMEGALGNFERTRSNVGMRRSALSESMGSPTLGPYSDGTVPKRYSQRASRSARVSRSPSRTESQAFQDFMEQSDRRLSRGSSSKIAPFPWRSSVSEQVDQASVLARPSVVRSSLVRSVDDDARAGEMIETKLVPSTTSRSLEVSSSSGYAMELESDDGGIKIGRHTALQGFVLGPGFGNFSHVVLVLNAFWIGLQTDYFARYWTVRGLHARPIEILFCLSFTIDAALRICAFRWQFFEYLWNCVDFALVIIQIFENIAVQLNFLQMAHYANLLRLVRLWRPIRNWRMFAHLRTQLHTIVITTKDLLWMLALTVMLNYVFAIVVTMLVTDYKVQTGKDRLEEEGAAELEEYFGTLDRSMIVMFMAISEGIHWRELSDPLAQFCSPWLQFLFAGYMSLILFAVMNVITANFIESAQEVAKEVERTHVMEYLHRLFEAHPGDEPIINRARFEASLEDDDMEPFLSMIGLEPDRAHSANLFALIDEDHSGTVDISELVQGCMNLTGNARALDLARLSYDVANERLANREHRKIVEQALGVRGRSRTRKFESRTSIIMKNSKHLDHEESALFHGNELDDCDAP